MTLDVGRGASCGKYSAESTILRDVMQRSHSTERRSTEKRAVAGWGVVCSNYTRREFATWRFLACAAEAASAMPSPSRGFPGHRCQRPPPLAHAARMQLGAWNFHDNGGADGVIFETSPPLAPNPEPFSHDWQTLQHLKYCGDAIEV